MISSFFSKTKPITYVALLIFLAVFYWAIAFFGDHMSFNAERIGLQIGVMAVLLLSVFVIDDMVKKEKITDQSAFAMLFFVLLMVVFPQTILDNNAIMANVFVLFSIKRLLEAKEAKNLKHKIFEATLLICIASVFYKWAILYFVVVLFTLNTYGGKNIKNWMAALVGALTFLVVSLMVLILMGDLGFLERHYDFTILDFDQSAIVTKLSIKKIVFLVIVVGFAIFDFIKFRKKGGGKLIVMRMLLLCFVLAFPLLFLESQEAAPILLAFFPAAVFLSNYVETIKRKRVKELVLIVFIALPFLLFFIEGQV